MGQTVQTVRAPMPSTWDPVAAEDARSRGQLRARRDWSPRSGTPYGDEQLLRGGRPPRSEQLLKGVRPPRNERLLKGVRPQRLGPPPSRGDRPPKNAPHRSQRGESREGRDYCIPVQALDRDASRSAYRWRFRCFEADSTIYARYWELEMAHVLPTPTTFATESTELALPALPTAVNRENKYPRSRWSRTSYVNKTSV